MDEKEFRQTNPEEPMGKTPQAPQEKAVGPIVGAVIIVVVLVLGGLYFWGQKIAQEGAPQTADEILEAPDETLESLEQQGTSDEIPDIEADLNATNLEELDVELRDIEGELGL